MKNTIILCLLTINSFAQSSDPVPTCTPPADISGTHIMRVGDNSTFTDATTGGAWSSNVPAAVTIDAGGVAHALMLGAADITYTVSGCASAPLHVEVIPPAYVTNAPAINTSPLLEPNPSAGDLIVKNANGELYIFNAIGRSIYHNEKYNGEHIDLSTQPSGIYYVKINGVTMLLQKK